MKGLRKDCDNRASSEQFQCALIGGLRCREKEREREGGRRGGEKEAVFGETVV